ncbi:DUF2262 domain-containing protein [Affinibrenneria salicis]|uniref:DUF2262 domain-containing protein n=1 Tax=Affinibrenneria salicis TaxID=2590031 RepID=A0A5J5G749_9GAMM|nr:DUF2262 domain-containing protein [Affinibrenneria salicis]KAA9002572.1 DUF2262 domain-containing protein [Affinibrenneria salicis]KAA9003140.1 DUF2262 domain-containing protein [Affinibrenneria salicis]
MFYYSDEILRQIKLSLEENEAAASFLREIQAIHAPGYRCLVIIQKKQALQLDDEHWQIVDAPPQPGGPFWPCADLYRCAGDSPLRVTTMPLPRELNILSLSYEDESCYQLQVLADGEEMALSLGYFVSLEAVASRLSAKLKDGLTDYDVIDAFRNEGIKILPADVKAAAARAEKGTLKQAAAGAVFYHQAEIRQWLRRAFAGDEQAERALQSIQAGHMTGHDSLMVIQEKQAQPQGNGYWRIFDAPPSPEGPRRVCVDLYRYDDEGESDVTSLPLPQGLNACSLSQRQGKYQLNVLMDGEACPMPLGYPAQFANAAQTLDLSRGVTEQEIVAAFRRIHQPCPPIELPGMGRLTCNAQLGEFTGDIDVHGQRLVLRLASGQRERAMQMLSSVECRLRDLTAWNDAARQFAAEQLLDIWNEYWADPDDEDEHFTHEQFIAQLRLDEIEVDEHRAAINYSNKDGNGVSVHYQPGKGFAHAEMG